MLHRPGPLPQKNPVSQKKAPVSTTALLLHSSPTEEDQGRPSLNKQKRVDLETQSLERIFVSAETWGHETEVDQRSADAHDIESQRYLW